MAARKRAAPAPAVFPTARALSLEELYCSPECFGHNMTPTPLQRAICRAIDGAPLGELADHPAVLRAFGGVIPTVWPLEVYLISGIRTGKSLLAAALAVRASQVVDLSRMGYGERARITILSLTLKSASVIFRHLLGNLQAQPILRSYLHPDEPPTADTVTLVQESTGKIVEVSVVAGAKAGGSLVGVWNAGAIFDEAPRMGGDEAAVNFGDGRDNVLGRMVGGAHLFALGSPWGAQGEVYEQVRAGFGKPTADRLVIRAPAYDLNPQQWTPEECANLRRRSPDAYRTDVEAEFLDPESALLSSDQVQACTRSLPLVLPPEPGVEYAAAMDPATRGNAWTLVVVFRRAGRVIVACARQWVGSKVAPLSPGVVLGEVASLLRSYGLDTVATDQWAADAIRDLALPLGLYLRIKPWTAERKVDLYEALRIRLSMGTIELPPDPLVAADLACVRRKLTASGVQIVLDSSSDSRHADYSPAIALACEAHTEDAPLVKQHEQVNVDTAFLARVQRPAEERDWQSRRAGSVSWLQRR